MTSLIGFIERIEMPLYDTVCTSCAESQEQLLTRDEEPDRCPLCGSDMVRLPVQRTNFSLKGSGWASDGYSIKK